MAGDETPYLIQVDSAVRYSNISSLFLTYILLLESSSRMWKRKTEQDSTNPM